MKKVRLQANFRIEEEDQEMIQALRRTITRPDGKVPSETDIWRLCLREIYDRDVKGKRGRKNRGDGGGAADGEGGAVVGDAGDAPIADEPPPPYVPVDDSKIPDFSDAEPQVLDLKAGSERLDERTLDQHFARVTPEIQRCVTTASRYGEIGAGSLRFKLRVLPSGKVESVTITAPASLRVWSIPACARKAVYQHKFPGFDGPAMAVSFSIDID